MNMRDGLKQIPTASKAVSKVTQADIFKGLSLSGALPSRELAWTTSYERLHVSVSLLFTWGLEPDDLYSRLFTGFSSQIQWFG